MINTIIFDFDGTLVDTNELILNSFKHISEVYHKDYDEDYILSSFGEPLKNAIQRDYNEHNIDEVLLTYKNYQEERFKEQVTLYDMVLETLQILQEKKFKLGIATSRLKKSTQDALKLFDIEHFFKCVITVDDVANPKPHKEPLEKAMSLLGSNREETIYVGDTEFDVVCAQNAGVTPALVGWHLHSSQLAKKHNVQTVLQRMDDLLKVIKEN